MCLIVSVTGSPGTGRSAVKRLLLMAEELPTYLRSFMLTCVVASAVAIIKSQFNVSFD